MKDVVPRENSLFASRENQVYPTSNEVSRQLSRQKADHFHLEDCGANACYSVGGLRAVQKFFVKLMAMAMLSLPTKAPAMTVAEKEVALISHRHAKPPLKARHVQPRVVSLARKPVPERALKNSRSSLPTLVPPTNFMSEVDAIKLAIFRGDTKSIFRLIAKNNLIGLRCDARGHSVIQLAAVFKTHWPLAQILHYLKRREAERVINRKDMDNECALSFALRENKFLATLTLMNYGADLDIQIDGLSPFAYAVAKKRYALAALLVINGAEIEHVASYRLLENYYQLAMLAVKDYAAAEEITLRLYRDNWDGNEIVEFDLEHEDTER